MAGMKLSKWTVETGLQFPQTGIGIDPGINFGISFVSPEGMAIVYGGKMPEGNYGIFACHLIKEWFSGLSMTGHNVLIEGPSYGSIYWQPQLAEIRFGFYKSFHDQEVEVNYIAPKSARLKVFGKGTIKASDMWISIDPNAADSLCIAICAAM
jgi:hypothetical protein